MTTWTVAEDGTLMHCDRKAEWTDCDCNTEGCMTAVCTKCQTELPDCED